MEVKVFDSLTDAKKVLEHRVPKLAKVGKINVCLVRINDELVAFKNECPHMGEGLHAGKVNYLNQIVCPLHTYMFDLKHGDEVSGRCGSLQFIDVLLKENGVFLSSTLF